MSAELLSEYRTLEARVRGGLGASLSDSDFGTLALEAHTFQRRWNAPYAAWCGTKAGATSWQEIPAVPQAMFKRFRLSCIPPELTTKTFRTSGTTGETRGEHHLLDTALYEASVLAGFEGIGNATDHTLFLTPSPLEVGDSSLAHMFGTLAAARTGMGFAHGPFLCDATGKLVLERLEEFFFQKLGERETVAIFGPALAFLHFFDWLGHHRLKLPEGSFALETGGFKGSGRDIPKAELYARFEHHLGLPAERVWNEYGMCELASQFYAAGLNTPHRSGPWMRARVISPVTGEEVAVGEIGILRVYDLANLSSVLAIETADFATRTDDGFILLGRDPGATPRGCSRAADEAMRSTTEETRSAPRKSPSGFRANLGSTGKRAKVIAEAAAAFPFLGAITADSLLKWLRAELGDAEALDRFIPHGLHQSRALAPGTILHIFSRNTPAAALQSLIRGLLLGSRNLCKLPSGGLPEVNQFVASLPEPWRAAIELSEELPDAWLAEANAVIVFGSDTTISQIHARIRPDQIFIPHGHKHSIAVVLDDPDYSSIEGAARDVSVFDQQGCLSPVILFVREAGELTVDRYAERLAAAMGRFAIECPPGTRTLSESNAIQSLRVETAFRAANGEPLTLFAGDAFTVIADRTEGIPATPLNRVIHVKPLPHPSALESLREHLSTVGIWPNDSEGAAFAASLGALRVCPLGSMQMPALTWHHDGQSPLASLVRWIDWESGA